MAGRLPSYTKDNLMLISNMASQIAAAAARYGVPAEAIAGALAQEQFDQKNSWINHGKMALSAADAGAFLTAMLVGGMVRNPFNPSQGASDNILNRYHADPNAMTNGQDF
ncbi:hypothetical protein XH98_00525 [Bradyrhizobium sp. CCBAU 51745]|uniref:hypothetical protein n=1 Tax=Bradyrhizobium sp. CCBAU 51745 TaxID=1325099 RepID=UPI0023063FAA|nr:hypothetical protein [Bradyrhizobium sp. CCBAU 51745]MDA9437622.1 hypothetical protein [Bradyrhizobium sp. CCBAU 51745]